MLKGSLFGQGGKRTNLLQSLRGLCIEFSWLLTPIMPTLLNSTFETGIAGFGKTRSVSVSAMDRTDQHQNEDWKKWRFFTIVQLCLGLERSCRTVKGNRSFKRLHDRGEPYDSESQVECLAKLLCSGPNSSTAFRVLWVNVSGWLGWETGEGCRCPAHTCLVHSCDR